jgi:hypothetical protein
MDQKDLQRLLDREEITDLIYRYCRSMDRIDAELGYSIWHEGAEADYGAIFKGTGRGFIDWVCERHRTNYVVHSHQITSINLTLDRDRAGSESYVTAALRSRDGDRMIQMTSRGRYVDSWERRNGRWGIVKRIYVHDFDDVREVDHRLEATGARDRTDPSYAVLGPNH